MLKKFFTVFLGSMAAIWLSFLLLIAIIAAAVFMWTKSASSISVKPDSILYLDLSGDIFDRFTPPTPQDIIMGRELPKDAFDEIIKAVDLAKTDSKIKGIFINLDNATMGLAMRQELRTVLADFKTSGKWIVAYGENFSQGDFFTAAIADELYINPSGTLAANGLSATVPFFKNALDKLGVEVQVIKVGTFKSAVEPFIMTQMSDSARMQYDVMLSSMWDGYVADVVKDRGLKPDSTEMFKNMAATPMTAFTAKELVEAKLFDDTMYSYQVRNLLRKKAGSDDDLNLISPRMYIGAIEPSTLPILNAEQPHIAVIYAVGDIVDDGNEGIVGNRMAPLIAKLADDDNVKGLVLRINSGGGSAFASEQIWASLEYFKSKNKPFVASMGDVAASGGYYIACGADRIFADPATITGSIGIFGIIPYAKDLLNNKLGIDFSVVETNPNAVFPRLDAPLTPAQHSALEKSINNGYDLFVDRVAKGRKMDDKDVRRIAEGRVWAGATAADIGLVDQMGGLNSAIAYIAQKTGLNSDNCVNYPDINMTPLQMMLMFTQQDMDMSLSSSGRNYFPVLRNIGLTNDDIKQVGSIVARIRNMNTIQAKMEDIKVY